MKMNTLSPFLAIVAMAFSVAACNPADPGTSAHPAGWRPPLSAAIALVHLQNPTPLYVQFSITDSSGKATSLKVPPRRSADVRVVEGSVQVTATPDLPSGQTASPTTQTLQTARGSVAKFVFQDGTPTYPASIQTSSATSDPATASSGSLNCATSTNARLIVTPNGATTSFAFSCQGGGGVAGSDAQDVTFTYSTTAVSANLPPSPLRACAIRFQQYAASSMAGVFSMKFSPKKIDCNLGESVEKVKVQGFFNDSDGFKSINPPVLNLDTGGEYGNLSFVQKHLVQPYFPPTENYTETYENYEEGQVAPLKTMLHLRYQFEADNTDWLYGYQVQLATDASPVYVTSPCANWENPTGLLFGFNAGAYGVKPDPSAQAGYVWEGRIDTVDLPALPGPHVIYVRLVPLDEMGQCVAGPTPWIVLETKAFDYSGLSDALEAIFHTKEAAAKEAAAQAAMGFNYEIVAYNPPVFDPPASIDIYRQQIVTKSGTPGNWPIGCSYLIGDPLPSDPWYQQALSGLLSALEYLAVAYNDIKSGVVTAVVSFIPGCDSTCKSLITAGLDYGLATLGLPPELPNLDQLLSGGSEYLAGNLAAIASDATGAPVPTSVVQKGTDQLASATKSALSGGDSLKSNDPYTWGKPDPYYRTRPATVWVKVTRDTDASKLAGSHFHFDGGGIWKNKEVNVPGAQIAPGASMMIPLVLEADLPDVADVSQLKSYNDANKQYVWYISLYQKGLAGLGLSVSSSKAGPGGSSYVKVTANQHYSSNAAYSSLGVVTQAPSCQ